MANRKQLKILRQGVAAWNAWREENPDAKINLRGAKLDGWDLSGANFRKADIRGASFRHAILVNVNFTGVISGPERLQGIIRNFYSLKLEFFTIALSFFTIILLLIVSIRDFGKEPLFQFLMCYAIIEAYLVLFLSERMPRRYVLHTDFHEADLTGAIFDESTFEVSFKLTDFSKSILKESTWRDAKNLYYAVWDQTILANRNVREILVQGSGQHASLYGNYLKGAPFFSLNLRNADLRVTDLMQADLRGADITGAKLYGSARENWIIDGVCCDYVYWDEAGQERTPPDRDFRPGEFEELHKQLPTFDYFFEQGFTPLDPLIMDRVVRAINERHKEFKLDLIKFDKRGEPHATFTVCQVDFLDTAKEQVDAIYEANRVPSELQPQLISAILGLIENQSKLIDKIPSTKELKEMGDTIYNIHGGQFGAVGTSSTATDNIFIQQIVSDLSRLYKEMQSKAATPEQQAATQDVAKAEQAAQQGDEPNMQQHLKNGGQWALDCAQKVGTDVLTEYLKKLTTGM